MKVFCVGTWKTGTTSMGKALHIIMGGKHQKWEHKNRLLYFNHRWDDIIKISRRHRTFDDTPWNCIDVWPKLKELYPKSKYVLTLREEESWFKSMVKWYRGDLNTFNHSRVVKEIYDRQLQPFGYKIQDMSILENSKKEWLDWYHQRNEHIINAFKDTNRLLIYNITKENGWETLCNFLEKNIPAKDFPHLNKNRR
tara:strand:+ start:46 stop:633 length:588 start_codon:yes stop_codon:yes gene_type:complete